MSTYATGIITLAGPKTLKAFSDLEPVDLKLLKVKNVVVHWENMSPDRCSDRTHGSSTISYRGYRR
jgi:hypothetical protein